MVVCSGLPAFHCFYRLSSQILVVICGGLRLFVVVCDGLSFSHTRAKGKINAAVPAHSTALAIEITRALLRLERTMNLLCH